MQNQHIAKYPLAFSIGQRVRALRKTKNMTASQLAEFLGISQQQFSRYECGVNRIDVDTLVKLSYFFSVSVHYFFEDIDKNYHKEIDLIGRISTK